MDALSSIGSGSTQFNYYSMLNSVMGSSSFSSVLSQAAKAASTPQERAQVAFARTQWSNLNTLFTMADPSTSYSSGSSLMGMASLFGGDNLFTLPSWADDVERLLGPDSTAAQAISIDRQAAIASQSLLNSLSNASGSAIDSLF